MDLRELAAQGNELTSLRHPWETARLKICLDLLHNFNQNILRKPDLQVLDMGCGDTWFMEQLALRLPKARFTGVDIAFTPEVMSTLKARLSNKPISIYTSLEETYPNVSKPFDVVLLLDVIEHIEQDVSFLQYLMKSPRITDETLIVITVPAFQGLFCSHDDFLGHYRRYTNPMLRNHLAEAGLSTEKLGYFFTSLIAPRVIQVLKEKILGKPKISPDGIGNWNKGAMITAVLEAILMTDYAFSSILRPMLNVPGLSNYAIAKRKK